MKLLQFVALGFVAALSFAQSIPAIQAKALDNSEILLPQARQPAIPDPRRGLLAEERQSVRGLE